MNDDVLAALDDEQRQVATLLDAPLVVIAGAGTGKTRAITHRIAHAVRTGRYDPAATLAVTFTTRAAGEMRSRLAALGVPRVQARTIHSAALRQAQYFWPKAYGVELPPVAGSTYSLAVQALGGTSRQDPAMVRDLLGEISWSKASNVSPHDYAERATSLGRTVSGFTPDQVAAAMRAYERVKTGEGVIDFDDILLCTAALLAEHESIAAEVRGAYRHFVVDEYQDISAIQHRLIELWVNNRPDVCVVGDPNQSIHAFAGARADFLLGFERQWTGAERVELVRNYRSTPQVLSLANAVMKRSRQGVSLVPVRSGGPAPESESYADEAAEAAGVAEWLARRHAEGTPYRELAVLYRINAQSPAFEAALSDAGVPYLVRGTDRFYERAEIRQALALLRSRASEEPADVAASVEALLTGIGWQPHAPASQGAQRERWESLNSLFDLIKDLLAETPDASLVEINDELAVRASWQQPPVGEAVTLSTMHAAKGLEWDAVAVVGVREGLVPFVLAESSEQLAEERRLLYVAITRARRNLHLSWAGQGRRSATGSRFLTGLLGDVRVHAEPTKRRRSSSLQSRRCRVCSAQLRDASEAKMGRHADCAPSYDEALFEALRQWRLALAAEQSVPAFVIFTDATLTAIAETTPTDPAGLLAVPGVGRTKAERYGEAVLGLVRRHQAEQQSGQNS